MPSRIETFLEAFRNADPGFSPAPLWWWSGEPLEIERLTWQLDQLRSMGIFQVVVINLAPNGTMFASEPDDPPFLSEAWWTIFSSVCDHARQIGMSIWFYDQIGFSGASYQAELAGREPAFLARQLRRLTVEGIGELSVECPISGEPVAAFAVNNLVVQPVQLNCRSATFTATASTKLSIVYTTTQGFDLLNPAACDALLDMVHRQFEQRMPQHLGTTIIGSFQDELPDLPTWGHAFAETFKAKFGYDLIGVIHRLFEGDEDAACRTRIHYQQHRASLAEAAFFRPFYQWHEEHGLLCGFDQQSPAREARAIGCISKYADYFRTQRWYSVPGSDHFGNSKLHASIAFLNAHQRVWLEGFHSTGWGGTLADTFDWMLPFLQGGANFYNPHAVYYGMRKGWWEWAAPSTCWRQPYAMHYATFANLIARLAKVLSTGTQQADIAILFPTTTVQAGVGPVDSFHSARVVDQTLHDTIGSMRWHQSDPGPMERSGLSYHLIDEDALVEANVEEGTIILKDCKLKILLLPAVRWVADDAFETIRRFVDEGGKAFGIEAKVIQSMSGRSLELPPINIDDRALSNLPRSIESPLPFHHRRFNDLNFLFVPAVTGMATVVDWPGWFDPIRSATVRPERYAKSATLKLPAKQVVRFDPYDGSVRSVAIRDGTIALDFGGAPFAVLAWSDKDEVAEGRTISQTPPSMVIDLPNEWSVEYVPTLPVDFADVYDPKRPEQRWPRTVDFTVEREGEARITRATFGPRATLIRDGATEPIVYSPRFGIFRDRNHLHSLGPKGHVPEEFIAIAGMKKGERVTIRTGVVADRAFEASLVIGANALKTFATSSQTEPAHLWTTPLNVKPGENHIEFDLIGERDGDVRAFWCLVHADQTHLIQRPERIVAPDAAKAGSRLSFSKAFEWSNDEEFVVKLSTAAVASLWVDDVCIGRQGGFDPYRLQTRGQVYHTRVTGHSHQIRVEVIDPGRGGAILVDAGPRLLSDSTWFVSRDAASKQPVAVFSKQDIDNASLLLYRRPHPLPRTNWLESQAEPSQIIDLPLQPLTNAPVEQVFIWQIPPGAVAMFLPTLHADKAELFIDESPLPITTPVTIQNGSRARLKVVSRQRDGAVFLDDCVRYEFGTGKMPLLGPWNAQGLEAYSGAVRFRQTVTFHAPKGFRLSLGHVRGTVEVRLNGRFIGVRALSPFCFDWFEPVMGKLDLEIIVTGTLANHLTSWSPTSSFANDQLDHGVFGPIRCEMFE